MIGDDFRASIGSHQLSPLCKLLVKPLVELFQVRFVITCVDRIEPAECFSDGVGDVLSVGGIDREVRIAERMNVSHRTVHGPSRHFEQANEPREDEVARRIGENLAVPRARDQGREPADFQFGAALDEQVGLIEHADVTGPGIDEVRVFSASGDGRDFDFVAANFLSNGSEIRQRGHDV